MRRPAWGTTCLSDFQGSQVAGESKERWIHGHAVEVGAASVPICRRFWVTLTTAHGTTQAGEYEAVGSRDTP